MAVLHQGRIGGQRGVAGLSGTVKIDVLTSLRFFAAALIVFGHSAGMAGYPPDWPGGVATYQGVTFFFVLSGFILTHVYPDLSGTRARLRFLRARFARLWPAHLATFLLSLAVYYWVRASLQTGLGQATAVANLALVQAWVPLMAFYFSFNAVSWSISVEVFFYLNFLWLIGNLRRTWHWKLAVSLAGAGVMMAVWRLAGVPVSTPDPMGLDGTGLIYIGPLARLFEFVTGMGFALAFRAMAASGRVLPGAGGATAIEAVLAAIVLFQLVHAGAGWFANGPPAGLFPIELRLWLERSGAAPLHGLLILVFAFQRGMVSRVLAAKGFVLLGEISYGIYMLHQILIVWMKINPELVALVPPRVAYGLFLAATLGGSYLMWRFIERPMRALLMGRRPAWRPDG